MLPAFGAAATLKNYTGVCKCGTLDRHSAEVEDCIRWFERAGVRSSYAATAAQTLRQISYETREPVF